MKPAIKPLFVKLVTAVVIFITIVLLPASAGISGAATTPDISSYTLQPGKSYELQNSDRAAVYYVNNDVGFGASGLSYDYVCKDRNKNIESYGTSSGRFSIQPGGTTLVSMPDNPSKTPMQIQYNPAQITIKEVTDKALFRYKLQAGKTAEIKNNNANVAFQITANQLAAPDAGGALPKYDYVTKDAAGNVSGFATDTYYAFKIVERESVVITAGNGYDIDLYMPFEWTKGNLSFKESKNPALYIKTLPKDASVRIKNKSSDVSYSVKTNSGTAQSSPKLDYVIGDVTGRVTSYAYADGSGAVIVNPGGTTDITASSPYDVKLFFPYEWLDTTLAVADLKEPSLFLYTLQSGKSIEFKNADAERTYKVAANNKKDSESSPAFDYVFKNNSGSIVKYGTEDMFEGFEIPPGGSTLVTAKRGYDLKLWLPAKWLSSAVTYAEVNNPALYSYTLRAGKTVTVKNSDENNAYRIATDSVEKEFSPEIDYVFRDAAKSVTAYGSGKLYNTVTLQNSGEATITVNNGYNLNIFMPYEWSTKSVKLTETAEPSLYEHTLKASRSLEIKNNNAGRAFSILTNATSEEFAPKYDFAATDINGAIKSFASEIGDSRITVGKGETLSITAGSGYSLKLWLPSEWRKSDITVRDIEKPALVYHTVNPQKSVAVTNSDTKKEYKISTDSTKDAASPKFDFVNKNAEGKITACGSENVFESFTVTAGGQTLLTAKNGYPLTLRYPSAWASHISVAETAGPVLYTYVLPAGRTAVIKNSNSEASVTVYTDSKTGGASPKLDYVVKNTEGIVTSYMPEDYYGQLAIPRSSTLTVSAAVGHDLSLSVPTAVMSGKTITVTESSAPALYYATLSPGEGMKASGKTDGTFTIATNAGNGAAAPKYDYSYQDITSKVTDYGTNASFGYVNIERGGTSKITVTSGADLKLWFPYEWTNGSLDVTFGNIQALYSYTLEAGKSAEFINTDKLYAYSIGNNSTNAAGTPKFDFVYKDYLNELVDYGSGTLYGSFAVLAGGRTAVSAARGYDLKLWFPFDWYAKMQINELSKPVLATYTVPFGKSIELTSLAGALKSCAIKNSSAQTAGTPRYDFINVNATGKTVSTGAAQYGAVELPVSNTVTVTPSNGYDLKLWIPTDWADIVSAVVK